jgi:hypothetical protein
MSDVGIHCLHDEPERRLRLRVDAASRSVDEDGAAFVFGFDDPLLS